MGAVITKAGFAVDPVHQVPLAVWAFDADGHLVQQQQQQPALLAHISSVGMGAVVTKASLAVDPVHQVPLAVWAFDADGHLMQQQQQPA
jgi:hypothetical protein